MKTSTFVTLRPDFTLHFGDADHVFSMTGSLVYDLTYRQLILVNEEGSEHLSITLEEYGYITEPHHVWIKDWSEHTGIAQQLIDANVAKQIKTTTVGPHQATAVYLEITP